jgi:hypothetical protein
MNIQFKHRPNRPYQWAWYYSPQGPEMGDVYKWCYQTFGHPGPKLGNGSWENHGGWIQFRDEKDMLWFTLRWS